MGSLSGDDAANDVMRSFASIMEGGENFAARMTAIIKTKKDAEAKIDELKLGQAAKQAFADADAKRIEAQKELEKAKTDAADTRRAAFAEATAMRKQAEGIRKQAEEYAEATRKEADDYKMNSKRQADISLADAQQKHSAAHAALNQAQIKQAEAERQKIALEQAHQETVKKKTDYETKIAVLTTALGKVV